MTPGTRHAVAALLAVLVAGLELTSFAAAGGGIRGKVDVRRPAQTAERPSVNALGTTGTHVMDLTPARAVVYLESAPLGAFEQPAPTAHAIMDQRNETFVPHVLAITTGTTVDFPNSDRIYHNVFSLSRPGRFDLGRYAAGHSKSVRFDKPGIIRVFCEIHSHMNAFILVFSHPFFAVTDVDGRYHIDNVPAGSYSVVAWNEGTTTDARPVVVPASGVADLDFTIR